MADRVELARRRKSQAPPPWVVWDALCDPTSLRGGEWFRLRPGEVPAVVLHQQRPLAVVWSSIWIDLPDIRIHFTIEPDGGGCFLTWTLLGPEGRLADDDLKRLRHRLNQLINGQLREAFDL